MQKSRVENAHVLASHWSWSFSRAMQREGRNKSYFDFLFTITVIVNQAGWSKLTQAFPGFLFPGLTAYFCHTRVGKQ